MRASQPLGGSEMGKGSCPSCGGDAFSKEAGSRVGAYMKYLCSDCRLAYRIWRDDHSPAESTILADWASQVPSD